MWQAQITRTETGAPITEPGPADFLSIALGGGVAAESVDAEQGVWLIDMNEHNSSVLERDGYFSVSIKGYTVEIELP